MAIAKNSAFTASKEQEKFLEDVRQRALNSSERTHPEEKQGLEKQAASDLLVAASLLIEEKQFGEAVDLIHRARDILNAD